MNLNPAAPENNQHHFRTYRDEQEWLEDNFGRGAGDPDFHGYPGDTIDSPLPTIIYLTDKDCAIDLSWRPF